MRCSIQMSYVPFNLIQALKPDDTTIGSYAQPFADISNQLQPLNYNYDGTNFTERWQSFAPDGSLAGQSIHTLNLSDSYDAYAAMAYGGEAKSKALGATANVGFGFTTNGQVDLSSAFSLDNRFDATRADHSGQFYYSYASRQDYWNVLMKRFGLAVIKDTTPSLGVRP